ncbi:sigma-54-dependent Fis family transcriptional regulator [Paroceanicella profunda]|uniref:Sigma-54-dependent Fis family transcriptional regulator n=1 Tax=Paroceanicella profunda TaxID=2579971 RepID=A0A5B8G3L9_9RHOB|nr:sigma-54 dependent transcriptional regulator [Paroceanicella profunda]QDL93413.1 sigma-54-dependent Fis family transcriptional regulator [Paroceanicella profunda]
MTDALPLILLVDDERAVRTALAQTLDLAGFEVRTASALIEAMDHVTAGFPGAVISDVRMPGRDGFDLLARIRALDPDLPVVLLTGHGDIPMAVRAMGAGAYDFLEKPCPPAQLVEVATRACEKRRLVLENRALRQALSGADPAARVIGASEPAERLRARIRTLGATPADLLITGETGTGKELAARAIHDLRHPGGPFVAVNCALLTEDLAEPVLFGAKGQEGAARRAQGGTLFLDEIGSMPPSRQPALLRLVEAREIQGPEGVTRLGLSIMAATNADPRALVGSGALRADLFFRLDVARLDIPPLRSRAGDIPALYRHFTEAAAGRFARPVPPLAPGELAGLLARPWPGNLRELRNVAERRLLGLAEAEAPAEEPGLAGQVNRVERALIAEALRATGGRVAEACDLLALPRKTLYDKLKRHGLQPELFRSEADAD